MNSCPNCRTLNRPVLSSLNNNVLRHFYRCGRCGCDYAYVAQQPAPAGDTGQHPRRPRLARILPAPQPKKRRLHCEAYYQLSPAKRRQIDRLMAIVQRKLEAKKRGAA